MIVIEMSSLTLLELFLDLFSLRSLSLKGNYKNVMLSDLSIKYKSTKEKIHVIITTTRRSQMLYANKTVIQLRNHRAK